MLRPAVLLAAVFSLAACAYGVSTKTDAMSGNQITRMDHNVIGSRDLFGTTVVLNAVEIEGEGGANYRLHLKTLNHSDWIFPDEISFKVDDKEPVRLQGRRLSTDVDCNGGTCTHDERYSFVVSPDLLQDLGHARRVLLRVHGYDGYFDREFSPENIQRFNEFCETYISAG